jgi:long-subunit fatty acid transport protein
METFHMRIKILLATWLGLIGITASAFEGAATIGARSAGLGRASVALSDFWSVHNNPAGMALRQQTEAGVYYENRFMMKELSLKSAAFVLPVKFGVLGLSFNQFGFSLFNENKLGLAYARSFGDYLRLGVQLDYLSTRFGEGYESADNVTFEAGVQSNLNEKMVIGAWIFNPVKAKLSSYTDERVPLIMRFGILYNFTDRFSGTAEVEKQSDRKNDLRAGLEYALTNTFFARLGLSTNPEMLTFGTGMDFGRLQLDIAASMHQVLGVSFQSGISYQFGK